MDKQLRIVLSLLCIIEAIVSIPFLEGVRTRGMARNAAQAAQQPVPDVAESSQPVAVPVAVDVAEEVIDEEEDGPGPFNCGRLVAKKWNDVKDKARQAKEKVGFFVKAATERYHNAKQAVSNAASSARHRVGEGCSCAAQYYNNTCQHVGNAYAVAANGVKKAKSFVADKCKRFEKWRTTDTHFIPSRYIDYDHVYCFGREVEAPIEISTVDGFVFLVPGWIVDYSKMIADAIDDENSHVDLSQHAFATANNLYIVLFYCGELYRFDQLHAQEDFSDDQLEEMRATFLRQLDLLNKFHDVCTVLALVLHFDFEISLVEKILIEQAVAFLCRSTTIDTAPLHITAIEQPEVRQKIYTKFKETLRKKLGLAIQPAH